MAGVEVGARRDPYAALRFGDFRLLLIGTFLAVVGEQMLNVAIGWELYERTKNPLALGIVGLVQVVPVVLLALPAGQIADKRSRKWISVAALALLGLCAIGIGWLSWRSGGSRTTLLGLVPVYALLAVMGVGRAFQSPALSSLLAEVVPPEHYSSAATWDSGAWQASSVVGPAIGGAIIATRGDATLVYAVVAALLLAVAAMFALLRPRQTERSAEAATLKTMLAGLNFVRRTPLILASITLDMFAVLLGGATALLPVFASDILGVGAAGLGWLRAAPAIGAITAALAIAHLPPFRRAGLTLLGVVAGFGVATIIFGLSTWFPLSLAMLTLLGALDNISVVIRSTLLLTRTPDAMRGRVNAVHYVFIGLSNEMGAFESGIAAAVLGTVGAVVFGGIGTLLVVLGAGALWPQLRALGRLEAPTDAPTPE